MTTLANEIRTARTVNAKQFILPGGDRKLVVSIAPKHYRDEKGRLYDIAPDALTIKDDTDEYVNDNLPFKFTLHRQGIGYTYVSRRGGQIIVTLTAIGETRIDPQGDYKVTREKERLTFHEVATDTDIVFELHRNGLRTYRVLKSAEAPREWRWSIAGDQAGLAKISSQIAGKDAGGQELAGLTLEIKDGECLETWDGTAVAVSLDRLKSQTTEVQYPVTIDPDVTEDVAADGDDGNSRYDVWVSSETLIARTGAFWRPGWRFTSVAIDNAASIGLAELKVNAVSHIGSGGHGTIYGYDTDNAASWGGGIRPETVAATTASTAFPQSAATGIRTYDVTAIVQEIVNRGGWASGNDMSLFAMAADDAGNGTYLEDFNAAGTDEARLEITLAAAGNRRRRLLLGT